MNRARGLVAVAAAAAVAVAALVVARERTRDDANSLARLLRTPGPAVLQLPLRVAELGTNAIPDLVDALDWEPGPFQRFANANRFPRHPGLERRLEPWRTDHPKNVQARAARLLACFGRDAAPAVPHLLDRVAVAPYVEVPSSLFLALLEAAPGDPSARGAVLGALRGPGAAHAAEALWQSRTTGCDALAPSLAAVRGDPAAHLAFLADVVRRCPEARQGWMVDEMADLLRRSPPRREAAANVLAGLSPGADAVLAPLAAALVDPAFRTPCNLVVAMGTNAAGLEPFLAARATNAVPLERVLAARAIAALHGRPAECVGALLREMRVRALVDPTASFMPADRAFADPYLGETTLTHREASAWLLGELGPAAADAAPALRGAVSEPSGWMPVIASWSLWRITRRAEDALPGLAVALEAEDPWKRHFALCAVAEMGPAAAVLEPRVRACAARDVRHRPDVAAALGALRRR